MYIHFKASCYLEMFARRNFTMGTIIPKWCKGFVSIFWWVWEYDTFADTDGLAGGFLRGIMAEIIKRGAAKTQGWKRSAQSGPSNIKTLFVSLFYIFSDRDQSLSSLGVSTDGIWKCMSTRQDAGGRKHLNTLNHLLSPHTHTYTLCHNLQTNRQVVSRQVSLSRNNE